MRPMGEYPRVKVKVRQEEDDDDQFALELSSLQSLKGFVPLFPYDSSPDVLPTSTVRVPDSSTSTSAKCHDPASKGTSTEKEMESDGNKTNTRPNLVSRPRAVLSSPDNDTMIGSSNKTGKEPHSTVRNHNLCHNRHTQCKVTPIPALKGPNKPRASMKTGHGKNDLHAGGGQLVTHDPSKIPRRLTGKSEPLRRKSSSKPTVDK